jgi:hypothetical protein
MVNYNFDDIRPYHDKEVKEKMRLLVKDKTFDKVLMHLFKYRPKVEMVKFQLRRIRSIKQLQGVFIYDLLHWLIDKSSDGLKCMGVNKLDKNKPYLFISNHRDIILDAAIINFLIFEYGMNTTQIAIGDNLLLYDWIEHMVKLNRSFVIKRSLAPRELMEASKKVSNFIRQSITEDKMSVWIAQREGRTKDGNDQTQLSVLKMLNMSNDKGVSDGFNELNIVPVSISYEIEPCGLAKMKELIKKEHYGERKTDKDDLKSMGMGMFTPKGRMHFVFGNPIKTNFAIADNAEQRNKYLKDLGDIIDAQIYKNFKLWPNNYVAYDMLMQEHRFKDKYTAQEQRKFEIMVEQAMVNIDYPITDITERFLKIYANPVINKLKVSNL